MNIPQINGFPWPSSNIAGLFEKIEQTCKELYVRHERYTIPINDTFGWFGDRCKQLRARGVRSVMCVIDAYTTQDLNSLEAKYGMQIDCILSADMQASLNSGNELPKFRDPDTYANEQMELARLTKMADLAARINKRFPKVLCHYPSIGAPNDRPWIDAFKWYGRLIERFRTDKLMLDQLHRFNGCGTYSSYSLAKTPADAKTQHRIVRGIMEALLGSTAINVEWGMDATYTMNAPVRYPFVEAVLPYAGYYFNLWNNPTALLNSNGDKTDCLPS